MPPMRLGMKNTVRKRFVPRIFCVRASASANAMTLITRSDTMAKRAVYQNACWKMVSWNARR